MQYKKECAEICKNLL